MIEFIFSMEGFKIGKGFSSYRYMIFKKGKEYEFNQSS